MTQASPLRVTVYLALLTWSVSASSYWDHRFYGNATSRQNETSSKINNGTVISSKRLYTEGGEVILQDTRNEESAEINGYRSLGVVKTSRPNSTQANEHTLMVSEGGGSAQESIANFSRKHSSMNDTSVVKLIPDLYAGNSLPSQNRDRNAARALQTFSNSSPKGDREEVNKRNMNTQRTSTALAEVGRSLEEHHADTSGSRSDAVSSYYDFLVNEGSYKFWSVFQVFTAALLIYSAFAAAYYAKYTFATMDYPDYLDDGFFFRRSGGDNMYDDDYDVATTTSPPQQSTFLGMSSATFQRIMDAISSKKYS